MRQSCRFSMQLPTTMSTAISLDGSAEAAAGNSACVGKERQVAIHDLMSKSCYGDMDAFCQNLHNMDFAEVRMVDAYRRCGNNLAGCGAAPAVYYPRLCMRCLFSNWVQDANIKSIRLPETEHMENEYHRK